MSIYENLDPFSSLAEAVGLTKDGKPQGSWFTDPLGTETDPFTSETNRTRGLKSIIYNDDQREALLSFVDDVLGPPNKETKEEAVWVPLFKDSGTTIFAVIKTVSGAVQVGFGIEFNSGTSTPSLSLRSHIIIFQLPREGGEALDISGSQPDWLLLGRKGGNIELSLDVNISINPPIPGELFLGGIFLSTSIPTNSIDTFSLSVGLRQLQLPGASTPRDLDLTVDSLNDLGPEVLEFIAGIIQAQAEALTPGDSTTAPFSALTALLGLRSVTNIPKFPIEEFFITGTSAIVKWFESIFENTTSRNAWLDEFSKLIGGSINTVRNSMEFTSGAATGSVGLRIATASGGGITITPWVELTFRSRVGAEVQLNADVFTADTTTGIITAIPAITASAVFGQQAGSATKLLDDDPGIGSIRIGVALLNGRPAFTLTAHDVELNGATHSILDLSSPDAALDAASALVDTALLNSLTSLGRPGELVAVLIGLTPPVGITKIPTVDILSNPLDAVKRYWANLITDSTAFSDVTKAIRELITGIQIASTLDGSGTELDPWIITIDRINLLVSVNGNEIILDLATNISTELFDGLESVVTVSSRLAQFNVINTSAKFFSEFSGTLAIRRSDLATARFDLGPIDLVVESFGTEIAWSARDGVSFNIVAPGLGLEIDDVDEFTISPKIINIPLPVFKSDGNVSFTPDWNEIETAIAILLGNTGSEIINLIINIIGWDEVDNVNFSRLKLSELINDPETEIRSWIASLVLDCDNVRAVLSPLTSILSGFRLSTPLGSGNTRDPFRASIAGEPLAPGLSAWFDPGCPLPLQRYETAPGFFDEAEPPEEGVLVGALHDAARALPDIRELLVGRSNLEEGLKLLSERMVGTDGLIGQPISLPDGVTGIDIEGYCYRELIALGAINVLTLDALETDPSSIVYVGCEQLWATNFGTNSIDARTSIPTAFINATTDEIWSIALPLPKDAKIARPDRSAVEEQASRIIAALSIRTAPITIIAYGAAGAAAIEAANTISNIERVVTVGSPWGLLSNTSFITGLSGDALRFINQIRRTVDEVLDNELSEELIANEIGPLIQINYIIDRAISAAGISSTSDELNLGDIPDCSLPVRRTGLIIEAVFGQLNADEIDVGMASLISNSIEFRYEIQEQPVEIPEALHVGVDLPVIDLNLGGLLVGAGATLELISFNRGITGDGFEINNEQQIILDLHFGVYDGWLVGGPGASQKEIEIRWMSARIHIPLGDSLSIASTEFILHETNCFGIKRERWVIDQDTDVISATLPTSEVHILMSEVVSRITSASEDLTQLLTSIGLVRVGGYDPQGLDRLILDTGSLFDDALELNSNDLASALRNLGLFDGTLSEITWSIDAANIAFDLETRTIEINLSHTPTDLPEINMGIVLSNSGLSVEGTLGSINSAENGVQLQARFNTTAPSNNGLNINWQLPGQTTHSTIGLFPSNNINDLIKLTAAFVPSMLIVNFLNMMRSRVEQSSQEAINSVLDSLNLLKAESDFGLRQLKVPWALFMKPSSWLKYAASDWVDDPLSQAINTLESLVPLVSPARTRSGWPLTDNITLNYVMDSGRLNLELDVAVNHTLGTSSLQTSIIGGISIDTNGSIVPRLTSAITFDDQGLALSITPTIRLDLIRPAPATTLQIYPLNSGFGSLIGAGATMAIPVVLNALISEKDNTTNSLQRDVARVLFDIAGALDLLESEVFTAEKITAFATDPISGLSSHLSSLAGVGISQIAKALDDKAPDDPTRLISTIVESSERTRLEIGTTQKVFVTLDGSSTGPAILFSGSVDIDNVGTITIKELRLSDNGIKVSGTFIADGFDVGTGFKLLPVVTVRAGVSSTGFERVIGIGLATDGIGDQSIDFRWNLDSTPPRAVVVNRTGLNETENNNIEQVALSLLSLSTSMAVSVALDALDPLATKVVRVLQNVAFTGGSTIFDTQLFSDLENPEAMLHRFYQLAFNLADEGIKIKIDNTVEIGFVKDGERAGVFISIPDNKKIQLSQSPNVNLEVVADWIKPKPTESGLQIFLIENNGDAFELNASVAIYGIGIRVSKTAGPLFDLGLMAIDAIGVHVYGEVGSTANSIGGGVRVQLDGLSFSPSAGSGNNTVANKFMSDAAESASPSARPRFSPSLAIQKAPGAEQNFGVTLSAGNEPGPWWVVVQRQLGPLYLEQFGFDAEDSNGSISKISLLFDARISLFGLSAEVDQLSLNWLGNDVFDVDNWSVDLKGLAVSADFSGVSLSGGLLKTDLDGSIGYVGMLMGRFGVYGLSLFGGYSNDNDSPSFFVFGAVVGTIGGPPAFFVTGIGGGLGINRGLRVPDDLSKFSEYPFINALDTSASPSENPIEELRLLAEYFPAEKGNFWFAAGISFTSFALVDGIAIVSVSFGNGLEINLLGLARMALPRPQAALVSIELGLLARFSTTEGLFLIQAQLTDNSWLLYPEVRLTGGFAFATWWKGSNSGQFVLTLGGYHPDFSRSGYPIVPRLGLVWRVTDDIIIKGSSYFTLTSEALMVGIDIEVSADFGYLWAKIAFGANAIVYFDPFKFSADAYARITAGLKIKTFFGTIRFSLSIGARIEVEGPEFHGKAIIEIGPCDVPVRFGNNNTIKGDAVDWNGFVKKYLEQASQNSEEQTSEPVLLEGMAKTISAVSGKGSLPAATDGETSAPSSDGSVARPFEVFSEFEITFVSTVPTKIFVFNNTGISKSVATVLPNGTPVGLGISPMDASNLTSEINFKLEKKQNSEWIEHASDLLAMVKDIVQDTDDLNGTTFGISAFPIGVWGLPEPSDLPSKPIPKGDVIFAASRIKFAANASFKDKAGPFVDYYKVKSDRRPLPLSATDSSRSTLLNNAKVLDVVEIAENTSNALKLAEKLLFTKRSPQSVPGLLHSGNRSATAKAAYVRSRTAPPLFGTLSEGLAPLNGQNSATTKMPIPKRPIIKTPRKPFVTGYMIGGAGVKVRSAVTTVVNGRIKRRQAPSLDSVRGRLGRSLPIKLTLTAAPPSIGDSTIIIRGAIPRTNLGGVSRSYRGGHIGSSISGALIKGLSEPSIPRSSRRGTTPKALEPGSQLRAGDLISLSLPDANIDLDLNRPELKINGDARVIMINGNGFVTEDSVISNNTLEVACCTTIIAVHANGGVSDLSSNNNINLIGWHDQSQIARLGANSAIGSGCVINIEGSTGRSRIGWSIAGDVVRDATAVVTRFNSIVKTIAVIVRSTEARRAEDFGVELYGATRVMSSGKNVEPVVIQTGSRSIMLFEVIPDSNIDNISIRVTEGGTRQVAGILASKSNVDNLVDVIAQSGVIAVATRLRAAKGNGCSIEWVNADNQTSPTDSTSLPSTVTSGGSAQPQMGTKKAIKKKAPKKKTVKRKLGGR